MVENKRKSLSKKVRFEVFKRDNFTCQYCGRKAPDVILEVDHINPVKNGGDNSITNLITSCFDCNRGKGKRKLTQNEEIKKQQKMLEELNKKREQLEMLVKWKEELENLDNEMVDKIEDILNEKDIFLSEYGKENIKRHIKKYGFEEVYECTKISIYQYYKSGEQQEKEKIINYIPKICNIRLKQKQEPYLRDEYSCAKIVENRLMGRITKYKCIDSFKEIIKNIYNDFKEFGEKDEDYYSEIEKIKDKLKTIKEVKEYDELMEEWEEYYGNL